MDAKTGLLLTLMALLIVVGFLVVAELAEAAAPAAAPAGGCVAVAYTATVTVEPSCVWRPGGVRCTAWVWAQANGRALRYVRYTGGSGLHRGSVVSGTYSVCR